MTWGLYISIPFCRFKCTYCNFASGVFPRSQLEQYLDALCWEIRCCGDRHPCLSAQEPAAVQAGMPVNTCDSIYLGGGTPSMLSPAQITGLFTEIRRAFQVTDDAEITLEAAPGSITAELAAAWRDCGVDRISLGVQSFVERELRAVGRPHSAQTVAAEMALLRRAGIAQINIDLIAGLPHQSQQNWDESLEWVARLRPEHVSVYMFEIDEDSRLGAEVLAGGARYSAPALPGEDATADFYLRAVARLAEFGYQQYEISNFALAGCDSRHNRKYWEGAPYLGFGVDAHSYDGLERRANTDSLEEYLARCRRRESPVVARNLIDDTRRTEERIFLGLRQNRGVELSPAERARYRQEIDRMTVAGLLEFAGGRLRLTERGRLLSNEVFEAFIE